MACKHERIKSVNCEIFCDICGAKLPIDYLVAKPRIAEQKQEEPAEVAEPQEEPVKKRATRKRGAK